MRSSGDFNSDDPKEAIAGIVLVARGDERIPAREGEIPRQQQVGASVSSLGAGGCHRLYVALGERVVPAPDTTSTTLYLPDWFHSLDKCSQVALRFVDEHPALFGAVVVTADSATVASHAVRRVIDAAGGDPNAICRAFYGGVPLQPVYLGAERIREAITEIGAGSPAFRYLLSHAHDMIAVDCTDLGNSDRSLSFAE